MIIICINLPQHRQRARRIRRDWSPLGELLFLPATPASACDAEPSIRGGGHLLVPAEVACRDSHNRAIRLVNQIGQTCCVIEDDAVPLPGFRWPEGFAGSGRLQLEAHGDQLQYGATAQLIAPGCPEIPTGYAADWWPPGYPMRKADPLIVTHGQPDSTTIHGRIDNITRGNKPLILGLGTGRCGTTSLAELLRQAGVHCTHEMGSHPQHQTIGWDEPERAARAIEDILARGGATDIVGDVASWWLPHIPYLRALHPNIRTIALRRDAEECAASWERWLDPTRNHWDASNRDPWTKCFPKFLDIEDDIPAAARKYHDYYYRSCRELDIEIFETTQLNTANGIAKILRHLDLRPDQAPPPGICKNVTTPAEI